MPDDNSEQLTERNLILRTRTFLNNFDTMDIICSTCANGGSLIDLCNNLQLRYSEIVLWINNNDERRKQYDLALSAQGQWYIRRLIEELKHICTVDIRLAYDESGNLLPIHQFPDDVAKAISSVEVSETLDGKVTRKVRMWDKLKAIELLGKNLSMFIERVVIDGTVEHVHTVQRVDLDERVRQLIAQAASPAINIEQNAPAETQPEINPRQ